MESSWQIMSRLLMPILLLTLSVSSAWAEWTEIGGTDDGMTVYIDYATIRRTGNLVEFWRLFDLKTTQKLVGVRFLSSKSQWQYDCLEKQEQGLAFTYFSKNMGKGVVVYSFSDPGRWEPVAPESIGETIFNIVCDKK
jgi:hypothetical protein